MNSPDSYGSVYRETMKKSMEEPAAFKPLNRRQFSWWDNHSEEVGMFLWIVAITLASAMVWIALSGFSMFLKSQGVAL